MHHLQVVLQTMTQKFSTRRKTTVRRQPTNDSEDGEPGSSTERVHSKDSTVNSQDSAATFGGGEAAATSLTSPNRRRKLKSSGGVLRVFNKVLQKTPPLRPLTSSLNVTPTPSNASVSSFEDLPPAPHSPRHRPPSFTPATDSHWPSPPPTPPSRYHNPPSSPTKPSKIPSRHRPTESIHSTHSVVKTVALAPELTVVEEPGLFPRTHLVASLQRFMRYSSACYGQTFLRLLGIGKHEASFLLVKI